MSFNFESTNETTSLISGKIDKFKADFSKFIDDVKAKNITPGEMNLEDISSKYQALKKAFQEADFKLPEVKVALGDAFKQLKEILVSKKVEEHAIRRLELSECIEKEPGSKHFNFDLGKYDIEDKDQVMVEDENTYTLTGSVDKTHFENVKKSDSWYKEKSEAAAKMLGLKDHIELDFGSITALTGKTGDILKAMASMTNFSDKEWKKMIKTNGYSKEEIYGTEGIYNLILAFQRAIEPVLDKYKFTLEEKNFKGGKMYDKITLRLGTKIDDRDYRYSDIAWNSKPVCKPKPPVTQDPPVCPPCPPVCPPVCPPPKPPVEPPIEPPIEPPKPPVEEPPVIKHRDPSFKDNDGLHKAVATREPTGRVATVEHQQYDEHLKQDLSSSILSDNYKLLGVEGLLISLDKMPRDKREKALGDFMTELGKRNPAEAGKLAQSLISTIDGSRTDLATDVIAIYDAKINDPATSRDEKALWEAQKISILFAQGTITQEDAQDKLREMYLKLKTLNPTTLSPELKEMQEKTLEATEKLLRQSTALDMVKTAENTLTTTFDDNENLDEFMKLPTSEQVASLRNDGATNNLDRDYEVAFSTSQIHQALMYLIQYKYPVDIDSGKKIDNPVDYYMNELKTSGGGMLKPAGAPLSPPSFVDFASELRLFEKHQEGGEHMGQSSWTNGYRGDKEVFMEGNNGLIEGSKEIFGRKLLLNNNPGGNVDDLSGLGAVERLLVAKIENAEKNGHFDEARALCIEVIKKQLDKKTSVPAMQAEVAKLEYEMDKKEGSKIRAQARLGLEAQKERFEKNNPGAPLPAPLASPGAMMSTIDNITKSQLKEAAIIQAYGNLADSMDQNDPSLSTIEKVAVKNLQSLNGKGWKLSAENAEFAASITKTVVEIVAIEIGTAGGASFIRGLARATTTARVGAGGERTLAASRALTAQRFGVSERLRSAGFRLSTSVQNSFLGRNRVTAALGRGFVRTENYLADASTWHARGAQTILHGATFVEMQGALNGELVNPLSADGAYQIGMMAGTFYGLGKMQQFMRGETAAARRVAALPTGARASRIDQLLGGGVSNRIAQTLDRISGTVRTPGTTVLAPGATGVLRRATVSGIEIGTEIGGFYALSDIQEALGVQAYELTGGKVGFSQTQREAMQETDGWRKFAAIAAPVLGLRTWRKLSVKQEPVRESHDAE